MRNYSVLVEESINVYIHWYEVKLELWMYKVDIQKIMSLCKYLL